jgi:hypothetical protein
MAVTKIADIIVPSIFASYAVELTATKSDFVRSGIVVRDAGMDALAAGGGTSVNLPFWADLTGDREPLSETVALTPAAITASQDIARIHNDGKAWGESLLSALMAGADPLQQVALLVAEYWARQDQAFIISSLKGLFAADSMSGNLHAIHSETIAGQSAATRLTGATFIDACAKLGDRADRLAAVAMHSAVESALRKLDLIDFIPDSEGKAQIRTFQGRRVIIDDGCPSRNGSTNGTVYTTYLFGDGAFAQGVAPLDEPLQNGFGTKAVELGRDALKSESYLINRRRYILHPRGVRFNSSPCVGANPTNAEIETATNWTRVYEAKNVRIVAVTHNI